MIPSTFATVVQQNILSHRVAAVVYAINAFEAVWDAAVVLSEVREPASSFYDQASVPYDGELAVERKRDPVFPIDGERVKPRVEHKIVWPQTRPDIDHLVVYHKSTDRG